MCKKIFEILMRFLISFLMRKTEKVTLLISPQLVKTLYILKYHFYDSLASRQEFFFFQESVLSIAWWGLHENPHQSKHLGSRVKKINRSSSLISDQNHLQTHPHRRRSNNTPPTASKLRETHPSSVKLAPHLNIKQLCDGVLIVANWSSVSFVCSCWDELKDTEMLMNEKKRTKTPSTNRQILFFDKTRGVCV